MDKKHTYRTAITWTGNSGTGTSGYKNYERSYDMSSGDKPAIKGSADPVFRGDRTRWNPEELLVVSLAACHQLAYLHLCAMAGVVVLEYADDSEGTMEMSPDGKGRFTQVTLRPRVTVTEGSDQQKATDLHEAAHTHCFIASSVNFPVTCEPTVTAAITA